MTNVTAFGAFVDIGVHQDGLVHVSQIADHFVKNPVEILKVGQKVNATVLEVDLTRNRIALSLKSSPDLTPRHQNAGGPRTPSQPRPQQPQSKNSNAFGSLASALDEAFKKP